MKHIIILGDGMADHPVERLGGKTLLQYANKPYMDMLAKKGKTGRLVTVPDGFHPGSEVANSSIMGYDQNEVYEGRGPLEAASIGYELEPTDLALRCNIINVQDGKIITHNGGNLETEDADVLIKYLNDTLGKKYPDVKFVTGIQYRHLLVVKHGNKHIDCAPPHDHPNEEWHKLMVKPILPEIGGDEGHISRRDTADLLNQLILESQELFGEPSFQCGAQGAWRTNGQSYLALGRRLPSAHAHPLSDVSTDQEGFRDFCRRPDSRHRPLRRSAQHHR